MPAKRKRSMSDEEILEISNLQIAAECNIEDMDLLNSPPGTTMIHNVLVLPPSSSTSHSKHHYSTSTTSFSPYSFSFCQSYLRKASRNVVFFN